LLCGEESYLQDSCFILTGEVNIVSADFQKTLKTHQAICSMSRKGNCWDNVVAERFFRSLKTERVYFRKYRTRDEARRDIIDCILRKAA